MFNFDETSLLSKYHQIELHKTKINPNFELTFDLNETKFKGQLEIFAETGKGEIFKIENINDNC